MEPIRTCIGCGKKFPKSALIRIGRTKEGRIEVGIREGRGAYVCYNDECIKRALKGDRLAKALKIKGEIPPSISQRLLKEIEVMSIGK
ncbi:YlxR family protein [bacterium]|nr:YlxR family protein [bacterium]